MSDEILKPCPICGHKASINSWWSSDEECGVAGVGCSRASYTNGYECARIFIMRANEKTAREDAIRIWNTRAELGSGTCRITASATDGLCSDNPRQYFELSCGHSFTLDGLGAPVACAVCGKAVER